MANVNGGSGIPASEMKHNGLRKRLDVLGFTQPLPLGAVPLVGAILEDLIQTTETLKDHKDQIHKLLQEKNAWNLGVESYKCDNSKLLSQVSALNKQMIQQNDLYQAKKCEFSKRLRNLEMDKKYLEDHLQQMGERFEELDGKYQDVLDPKRKLSRKPFVSTVKSGCIIPPTTPGHHHHHHHNTNNPHNHQWSVCPSRCPASAKRKELEVERDRLQQDNVTMQEQVDVQSKQIEVRDREIDRLSVLLSTEGRPVKALAEDCCYRNVKQLQDDVNHLQRENSLLKSKLVHCEKASGSNKMMQAEKDTSQMGGACLQHSKSNHSCEAQLKECNKALQSCDEVQRQLREKEKTITHLRSELRRCQSKDRDLDVMNQLSNNVAERVKLQSTYMDMLGHQQKVLKEANRFGNTRKENCENEPVKQRRNAEVANLQKEIDYMRKQLVEISVFNERQDQVRKLQSELAAKDSAINEIKNKSFLSAATGSNSEDRYTTDRSWSANECGLGSERASLERENRIMNEKLNRLAADRDHLKLRLDTESENFSLEREALNNTLDKLKCRLDRVEQDNMSLLAKQEPKNAAIMEMQSDVKRLRCEIENLRRDNDQLQTKVREIKRDNYEKDQELMSVTQQLSEMDIKLKQSNRKLSERGTDEQKLYQDINKVNAELRKCRENYSSLEQQNARINAQLCDKLEETRRFQREIDGFKEDRERVVEDYKSMKSAYREQVDTINDLQAKIREMSLEMDKYKFQIEGLHRELKESAKDNKDLADQLSEVECEFSSTKHMLTESQVRNDELQARMKKYMFELERVGKALEDKEREREEMVDNLKKVSEGSCKLQSKNISMGAELCQHRNELDEAKKQITVLKSAVNDKEAEMSKMKENANQSLNDIDTMRSDLEECYETHKKLHDESTELKHARQEMIMNIEKLKNELETWKTLHDEMKRRNDHLKYELKGIQCEDYPNNIKALQKILAENREVMDSQVHKIATLSSQLAEAKEQMSKFKMAVEIEKSRADPLKRYLERSSELEKMSSLVGTNCDEMMKSKQVAFTKSEEDECQRRSSDPTGTTQKSSCHCLLKLNSREATVTAPGFKITGGGTITLKNACQSGRREVVPIPRSISNSLKDSSVPPSNRHQSCSPQRSFSTSCHNRCRSTDSVKEKPEKMQVEMNMSGLITSPTPPPPPKSMNTDHKARQPISATQVAMATTAQASTKRLLDDVRKHGQSKRQWSSGDEIEDMIKSQKECAGKIKSSAKAPGIAEESKSISTKDERNHETEVPSKPATKVPEANKITPIIAAAEKRVAPPAKRTDIPKMSLVASFIPKEQKFVHAHAKTPAPATSESKKIDDTTFKPPPTETSVLEKGFNTVVQELKQITHTIFGKPVDGEEDQIVVNTNFVPEPQVFSDTVKERIQRFQSIVNKSNKNEPKPTVQIRPMQSTPQPMGHIPRANFNQVPTQNDETNGNSSQNNEDPKKSSEKLSTPQQQLHAGIIRRVVESISQGGGIKGLSTLHKEDVKATKASAEMEQLQPKQEDKKDHTSMHEQKSPSIPPITSRRPEHHVDRIPAPEEPFNGISSGDTDQEVVIDLTESLRGFESPLKSTGHQSSIADSDVVFVPNSTPEMIHTISSELRKSMSYRSSDPVPSPIRDRFQEMIYKEPSIKRHEEYNQFVRQMGSKVTLLSTSSDEEERKPCPRSFNPKARRLTVAVRNDPYVTYQRGEDGALESTHLYNDILEQDDGCVGTSTGTEEGDEGMINPGFINATVGGHSPVQRAGRSILDLSARSTPKKYPIDSRFVNHLRGHDSGPSLHFSALLSGDEEMASFAESFNLDDLLAASEERNSIRNRGGLVESISDECEDEDEGEEEEENEYEDEDEGRTNYLTPNQTQSASDQSGTPQTIKGPYYGTEYGADESLRNLDLMMGELMAQEKMEAQQKFSQQGMGAIQKQKMANNYLMSKLVNSSHCNNSQRNYLDGLQSSVDVSTNDEMSVAGTSSGQTRPIKYFCSISKSMDNKNSELNMNVMLVDDDEDSVSCMSEGTEITQESKMSTDDVYLAYSRPNVSQSWIQSLIDDQQGGGEGSLTDLMDSEGAEKATGSKYNGEMLTKLLNNILMSNDILSASDALSLASASAPVLPADLGAKE